MEVIYDAINSGKQLKFSDMNEAMIYKIDKNGNTVKIAVYDYDLKAWIKQ